MFDPTTGEHAWRDIPYQTPAFNSEGAELALKVDKEGATEGTLTLVTVGRHGSTLRRAARNVESMSQVMQRVGQELLPGASTTDLKLDEVKDLRAPARVSVKVSSKTAARAEDGDIRMKVPTNFKRAKPVRPVDAAAPPGVRRTRGLLRERQHRPA